MDQFVMQKNVDEERDYLSVRHYVTYWLYKRAVW